MAAVRSMICSFQSLRFTLTARHRLILSQAGEASKWLAKNLGAWIFSLGCAVLERSSRVFKMQEDRSALPRTPRGELTALPRPPSRRPPTLALWSLLLAFQNPFIVITLFCIVFVQVALCCYLSNYPLLICYKFLSPAAYTSCLFVTFYDLLICLRHCTS